MKYNRVQLEVSDMCIANEYKTGLSMCQLAKKYNTRYGVIKRRIINSGVKLRVLKCSNLYTENEDNIIILLRNCNYTMREISEGLFDRSFTSVTSRFILLSRDRKVI